MGVIEEQPPNLNGIESGKSDEGSPKPDSEVKEAKLIEFSPTGTPTHAPNAKTQDSGLAGSKERLRSVSECNTSSTEKRKSRDVDTVSQTSIAEEDETTSLTSAKEDER